MAAIIGNLGPFDENADRFEAYVAANDIDDDKKVNVFLAVIGPDAYKSLKNLCDPDNPNTKTFTPLTQLFCRDTTNLLPLLLLKDTSSGLRHKERARVYQNSSFD